MQKTAILALLLACGAAQAADWVWVAHSKDGKDKLFVDDSSIRIVGGIRHLWHKSVNAPHTDKGSGTNANKFINYDLSKVAFNCAEETIKYEGMIIYFEDGTIETMLQEGLRKGWYPVPPESILSFEMKYVCEWKPK